MKTFALVVLFIVTSVCCVLAADPTPTATPSAFGIMLSDLLTNTVFPVLGALALGFVTWAANKVGAKFKIDALTADNNFVTRVAAQGVAFAEEKAANYAKNTQPLTSSDKLNSAIAYVLQQAPKVTPEQAQSIVTSALAMLPGVGATGNAAIGTPTTIDPLAVVPGA
jgi:hypothetical protein